MNDQEREKLLNTLQEEYGQYFYEFDMLLSHISSANGKRRQTPIVLVSQFKIYKLLDKLYPELESMENIDDFIAKLEDIGNYIIPLLKSSKYIYKKNDRKYEIHKIREKKEKK